eukprot:COSAG05_NODE_9348_length_630_cov_0.967985_1_plen_191_part_10
MRRCWRQNTSGKISVSRRRPPAPAPASPLLQLPSLLQVSRSTPRQLRRWGWPLLFLLPSIAEDPPQQQQEPEKEHGRVERPLIGNDAIFRPASRRRPTAAEAHAAEWESQVPGGAGAVRLSPPRSRTALQRYQTTGVTPAQAAEMEAQTTAERTAQWAADNGHDTSGAQQNRLPYYQSGGAARRGGPPNRA